MTIERFLELIFGNAGVIFLLLVVLWSGFKGYWVFGKYYDEQTRRIERLEERLERATRAAESGTTLGVRATRLAERTVEGSDADAR